MKITKENKDEFSKSTCPFCSDKELGQKKSSDYVKKNFGQAIKQLSKE